jgi:hypothetical protein
MSCREMIGVYSENHKRREIQWVTKVQYFNVKVGGAPSNHRALIGQVAFMKYFMQIYAKSFCVVLPREMLDKCLFRI